jgi:NADH dehydrogenase/putative oxidoreductase
MSAARQGLGRRNLARGIGAVGAVLRAVAPLAEIWARVALAGHVIAYGVVGPGAMPAFAAMAGGAMGAATGAGVDAVLAVLLIAGLFARPVALAVLIASAGQVVPLLLAMWLLVQGAGVLSLDAIVRRGLASSALPLARPAIAAGRWSARVLSSPLRVVVRVALAAMLLGWAGGVPGLSATLALPGAVLLALGLATPVVSLALAVAVPGMAMMHHAPPAVLLPTLLVLLATRGGGRWSLDAMLAALLRRERRVGATAPEVVILGAGFGGMACAEALRHAPVRVTVIDRCNHHLFQPLLYQVATAGLSPADIATPIRNRFRGDANVTVLHAAVEGIDTVTKRVRAGGRELPYDKLVIATGATHGYFGNEAWAAHAPGLKTVADAVAIRGRILRAFERAEQAGDADRAALLTFVIVGGGPTGVELAGAIAELAREGLAGSFRRFDPADARILLVQAAPRLLPTFPASLSEHARAALAALGVEVLLERSVKAVDAGGVVIGTERVDAATVIWAAGVMASPAASWLGIKPGPGGRIVVGRDLTVPGLADVFVVGDLAASAGWDGKPVPGLAPAAKQMGRYAADAILAAFTGEAARPFRYRHAGSLATIGRSRAVADFGRVKLWGGPAWWLWGLVHVAFLADLRSRVGVVVGWLWSYATYRVNAQLITGDAE